MAKLVGRRWMILDWLLPDCLRAEDIPYDENKDIKQAIDEIDGLTPAEHENLEGGGCDCLCLYDIYYSIYNLPPGAYTVVIDELYSEEDIVFDINLFSQPTGTYCVNRYFYPWGN